ncbi:Mobile element protein [Candidatus Enterovibrio altilux]|uniref:Mobile element protein n=1 Tax=Candidatus Enterovibrio altilux TaxID=1927128 RepID=A0A291B993_9GAMM|nr:Mobile element protein [Candidatus Enterovibrio luxaltus]
MQLPLAYPCYSYINKRTRMINLMCTIKNQGTIQHLAIDSTVLKVYR